jgi:hypothetical protein
VDRGQINFFSLEWETNRRRVNYKLANGIKIWKGNGNTQTLLFSVKKLEIFLKFYINREEVK